LFIDEKTGQIKFLQDKKSYFKIYKSETYPWGFNDWILKEIV
jgi:hypothetical protein